MAERSGARFVVISGARLRVCMSHSALERELNILLRGMQDLVATSGKFHQSAKQMKWAYFWKNIKCWIGIAVITCILILILLLVVCDPNFKKCSK